MNDFEMPELIIALLVVLVVMATVFVLAPRECTDRVYDRNGQVVEPRTCWLERGE